MEQNTGDFDATGHVSTTRQPENQKAGSAMLDSQQPTQGTADRVTSTNKNQSIRYQGNAVVWQSANRIQGDRIDIDRAKKSLIADGKVVTQFQDDPKEGETVAQPLFTIVKAQHLVYTDADRVANYTGGVDFERSSIVVKSTSLKAWLNERDSGQDSRLDHALSDGKVEIVQSLPGRRRVGTSEHAEYYTNEGKVTLSGGEPQLTDSVRGNIKGEKLTYYTDNDRLDADGIPKKQSQSRLRKKS
jgi:lipopolysaccharide export system protein LptA